MFCAIAEVVDQPRAPADTRTRTEDTDCRSSSLSLIGTLYASAPRRKQSTVAMTKRGSQPSRRRDRQPGLPDIVLRMMMRMLGKGGRSFHVFERSILGCTPTPPSPKSRKRRSSQRRFLPSDPFVPSYHSSHALGPSQSKMSSAHTHHRQVYGVIAMGSCRPLITIAR